MRPGGAIAPPHCGTMIAPGLRLNTRKGCASERPMETPDLPAPRGGRGPRRFHTSDRVLQQGRFAPKDLEHQPAPFSRLLSEEMNLRSLPTWTYRTHLRDVHATRNRSCGRRDGTPTGDSVLAAPLPGVSPLAGPDIRKRPASQKRLGARRNRRIGSGAPQEVGTRSVPRAGDAPGNRLPVWRKPNGIVTRPTAAGSEGPAGQNELPR
jgi:hypothetical protein